MAMEIVFSQHKPLSHANVSRRAVISLERWSWHKNQVTLFSENTNWGLSMARACVWSLWEGGRAFAVPAQVNPAGSVAPDCRVSPWFFMPAGSTTASFFPSTAHKLLLITPNEQVSAMDQTPALYRAFPLDGAILSFSRENPRQAEGIFVSYGEIQISFADFHFSHFKGLTSSRGIKAVSKLSSLLGTPVIDTPCHREDKRSVLGSIFQYPGILKISASYFLLCTNKTMSGF